MYLAYWVRTYGAIAKISNDPVHRLGHDVYYDLISIMWSYDDNLSVITGYRGVDNKPIVSFGQYNFMKTFDSIQDATKYVITEMFR